MKVKRCIKIMAFVIITMMLFLSNTIVYAEESNGNYTYDAWEWANAEPNAYMYRKHITGKTLGVGDLSNPQDIFIDSKQNTYLVDTGNNRIIVLDTDMHIILVVESFSNNGKEDSFKDPSGIFINQKGNIYIADTSNSRILVFDEEFNLLRCFSDFDTGIVEGESFTYRPIKVVVDAEERMYVVSQSCNNGIIQLDRNGDFINYYGALPTKLTPTEIFLRSISTRQQSIRQKKSVPTAYSNLDINDKNFVFGLVSATGANIDQTIAIRKMNFLGNDVLRRQGVIEPCGDVSLPMIELNSRFVDIAIRKNGVYSAADATRGRVFTYNNEGDLLYVFGGQGQQEGDFVSISALDSYDDDTIVVLDSMLNQLVLYSPTDYGKMIHRAVQYQYNKQFLEAEKEWSTILEYSAKSELAMSQLGESYLRQGDYENAIHSFKLARDDERYSVAYEKYRKSKMEAAFPYVCASIVIIVIFFLVKQFYKKIIFFIKN